MNGSPVRNVLEVQQLERFELFERLERYYVLDIEIFDRERIILDKPTAGLDFIAH
jgi:hypothetical protein